MNDPNDPEPGTVAALREALADLPEDMRVVLAKDGEGNGFSPMETVTDAYYEPESTWSGETWPRFGPDDDMSAVDPDDLAPAAAEPVIIIWPVN